MEVKIFHNRMTVQVASGQTMREVVIRDGFIKAIPECMAFTGDTATLFQNAIIVTSRIRLIDCQETEEPTVIAARDYLTLARGSSDYAALWQSFIDMSLDVNNEFMEAVNADMQLRAPVEVQPSSASDEELETMGIEGERFLSRENVT